MDHSDLGDRMKRYESITRYYLTPRIPIVIRIDGKNFSTYTRDFNKPHDINIMNAFIEAGKVLLDEVQGAKLIYMQSDEISILINNYEKFDTESWFQNNIQKIVSVSASITTAHFNQYMWNLENPKIGKNKIAYFDSRVFVVPREDAANVFLWRQQDAERNSVSSLAQAHFTHKQLHGKNVKEMKDMLINEKGINWNTLPTAQKRGYCVLKSGPDLEIPRFSEDREYINKHLAQIQQ